MKLICVLFIFFFLALSQALDNKNAKNCFARDTSGVQRITLSDGDTFEVLCNSDIAGAGWLVIQQRINGRVDFNKDWKTYQDGFGDFWDGDFFLGLEKIYRLTSEQPQELYIHMKRFNGTSYFARYDEFAISGDDDKYKLSKLGTFSGTTIDELRDHKNKKFAIARFRRAPEDRYGGWWFTDFDRSNLNAKYFPTEVNNEWTSIYWEGVTSLKQVKMMIRPKKLFGQQSRTVASQDDNMG